MSKYNLVELLNEIKGGRTGTYLATLNQLEDAIKSLDSSEDIENIKTLGISGDEKTKFEYIVSPIKGEPFSIYPFKFDPEAEEAVALPFSIAGDIQSAKKYMGMHGDGMVLTNSEYRDFTPQMKDMEENKIEEVTMANVNVDEIKMHLDAYEAGTIDGDDLHQAISEMIFGKVKAPGMFIDDEEWEVEMGRGIKEEEEEEEEINTDDDFKREQRYQLSMRKEEVEEVKEEIDEAMMPRPSLFKGTEEEIKAYFGSLKREYNRNKEEFKSQYMDFSDDDWEEDFANYIADKSLQEHFGRFLKDYQ